MVISDSSSGEKSDKISAAEIKNLTITQPRILISHSCGEKLKREKELKRSI